MQRPPKLGFSIHNYFFAKALDQVRPGGIVAFVTSRYTMDSKNPDARKYLAQRAELLGAIRLPNNAFRANAGTADEMKLLQGEAEKIRDIENKLTMIEEKYPEAAQQSTDGAMSVPAGSDMTTPLDDGSMQKFPAFEGKDLDGNPVKSDELFSGNAVTVVNF